MRRCTLDRYPNPPVGFEDWVYTNIANPVLKLTGRGRNIYGDCPFCHKGGNHFSVNLDNGTYKCYICGDGRGGIGGNFADLVARLESIPYSTVEEFLYNGIGTTTVWDTPEITPISEHDDFSSTVGTVDIMSESEPLVSKAIEYLEGRNISRDLASQLQVRVGISGKYGGRVLIPVVEAGEVINFIARDFTGSKLRYTGPSLTDGWTPKSECIFNMDNISEEPNLLIVEGVFDAVPLLGLDVVAILGKSLSDIQLSKLLKLRAQRVTVLLDGDEPFRGSTIEQVAKRIAQKFYALVPEVRYNTMPRGTDPASHPRMAEDQFRYAKALV